MSGVIHGIHLSDTHIGPSRDFEVRGASSRERLDRIVRAIGSLDFVPDFVIHTGDMVDDPDPRSYAVAAEALAPLGSPLYCVTGNHDDAGMIRDGVPMGPMTPLTDDPERLTYHFELPGLRSFVLDAKLLGSDDPHGEVPENQLVALQKALAADDKPFAIFVHFPPFGIHSSWIDDHLPLRNGEALHELIRSQSLNRIRGVFFGHLHRDVQQYRDGVLYSGVSSPVCEFSVGVEEERFAFCSDCPLVFHQLSFSEKGVVVKAFAAP
ncbi:MAG: metallophosphoesterase [Verrucomicrobiae bacterium]|nr:metallophosphoesterase [Verrucomicrobiae bacterium]